MSDLVTVFYANVNMDSVKSVTGTLVNANLSPRGWVEILPVGNTRLRAFKASSYDYIYVVPGHIPDVRNITASTQRQALALWKEGSWRIRDIPPTDGLHESDIRRVAAMRPDESLHHRELILAKVIGAASPNDRLRGHVLRPPAGVLSKIPALGDTEDSPDPKVWVKFFSNRFRWYVTEWDGRDSFFGWVRDSNGDGELGYFSLAELDRAKGRFGPAVERDLYWTPRPLSQAKREFSE